MGLAQRCGSGARIAQVLLPLAILLLSTAPCLAQQGSQASSQDKSATSDKSSPQNKKDKKSSDDAPTTRLKIRVTGKDKPISNATVYVRFNVAGGFLHKDKLAELDLKTNEDGTAKVPDLPQGRVLIQVIAKDWHTYGKWYDVEGDEQTIEIKLEPPTKWY